MTIKSSPIAPPPPPVAPSLYHSAAYQRYLAQQQNAMAGQQNPFNVPLGQQGGQMLSSGGGGSVQWSPVNFGPVDAPETADEIRRNNYERELTKLRQKARNRVAWGLLCVGVVFCLAALTWKYPDIYLPIFAVILGTVIGLGIVAGTIYGLGELVYRRLKRKVDEEYAIKLMTED